MENEYRFGKIYDEPINIKDADHYANLFGEGSTALTALIKYCIVNNIPTFASCKGHPEERGIIEKNVENGYLAFRITDNIDLAYYLASLPYEIKDIKVILDYNYHSFKKSLSIEVPAKKPGMSEVYFNLILEKLMMYQEIMQNGDTFEPDEEVRKLVDFIYQSPSNAQFYITNKNFIRVENKYNSFITYSAKKCPHRDKTTKLHDVFCEVTRRPKNLDDLMSMKTIL